MTKSRFIIEDEDIIIEGEEDGATDKFQDE